MTIREALRELDLWGAGAVFAMTEYEDSNKRKMQIIKDWKELVNQVIMPFMDNLKERSVHNTLFIIIIILIRVLGLNK